MSEDPTLASPRTPSTATTSANPLMEADYEENDTTVTFDENGPMKPSRSTLVAMRAHLAHPGKGNIDRLTELESWKIFQMLDVSGNGLLYSSDIQRFLGMIDEDNIYTDEDVNYWMVRDYLKQTNYAYTRKQANLIIITITINTIMP